MQIHRRSFSAFLAAIAFLSLVAPAAQASEGRFFSEIVQPSDQPLVVSVKQGLVARIINLDQESGSATRAVVTVTKANGASATVGAGNVAGSDDIELQKDLIVAGPATITVNPLPDAKIYVAYRIERN